MNNEIPLKGKGVLITRQRHQADDMAQLILAFGGKPFFFPVIETVPAQETEEIKALLGSVATFQWLVFTSTNSVDYFFHFYSRFKLPLEKLVNVKVVAVGTATAKRIEAYGITVELIPDMYIAESIVQAMNDKLNIGDRVLLPKANIGRDTIANGLMSAGMAVTACVFYHTIPVQGKHGELCTLLRNDIDIVTFTSSSTVHNFIGILGAENKELLRAKHIACIGPKTAETASEYGLEVSSIASVYTVEGMIQEISRRL